MKVMRLALKLVSVTGVGLMVGCAADSVTHGLYEGIKVRRELQASPPERFGNSDTPDYRSYERMRKERSSQ
jgi:hypothetical protein